MGKLVDRSGRVVELAGRHRIGRDPWSDLVVSDALVSGSHAMVVWGGDGWAVRDLGSRNGTRVDGETITAGIPVPLESEGVLEVGPQRWVLTDASAPRPMLVGSGVTVLLDGAQALPDSEIFVVPDPSGTWWLDDGSGARALSDRLVFEAGGRRWTAHIEGALQPTREDRLAGGDPLLSFRVSRDEEHVEWQIRRGPESVTIPSRAHHYTLVTLARQRLADRSSGIAEPDAGWLATPALCRQLRLQRGAVYTHLYRARKQLVDVGLPEVAERLVEHRTEATQLRLGLSRVEVADG